VADSDGSSIKCVEFRDCLTDWLQEALVSAQLAATLLRSLLAARATGMQSGGTSRRDF
jgi:hypothetical protein